MKTLQTKLSASSVNFRRRMMRNGAVAAAVTALSSAQAYAAGIAIDTAGIEAQITSGATNAGAIAGYVAIGLSVLACAGIIFGMLRKA